jgi:hypothetical protein
MPGCPYQLQYLKASGLAAAPSPVFCLLLLLLLSSTQPLTSGGFKHQSVLDKDRGPVLVFLVVSVLLEIEPKALLARQVHIHH